MKARYPGRSSGTAGLLLALLLFLAPAALAVTGQLNLNTATFEELQLLPFIGETRARAILDYRRQHGPFKSLDELPASKAGGERAFKAIRPYLTLAGPTALEKDHAGPAAPGLEVRPRLLTRPGEIILLPDREYHDHLLPFIRQAERQIDLAMFLFKITDSPGNRPATILRELIAARKRGRAVNVLLEISDYDEGINRENRKVAETLRRGGVNVSFDAPRTTTHAKLAIIDNRFCFLGSHNLTHAALAFNHEFSLLIDNRRLAEELGSYLRGLRLEGKQ